MHRPNSLIPVVLTLALIGSIAPRQTLSGQDARDRTIYLSALDTKGDPVTDIRADEIVVTEDRIRREVLRVSKAVEPIDVAVMVDNSTASSEHLVSLRQGLTRFVEAMPRAHRIALIGLADRPTLLTDYTQDLARLTAAIGRVFPQPSSGMTLLDALVETSRGLEKRQSQRAAILAVVTDGLELGHYDDRTVVQAIDAADAAFHAILIGNFSALTPEAMRYRSIVLSEATRRSGGGQRTLATGTAVPQAMEHVARELSSQLKVVYARPQSLIPPETVEVTVTRAGVTARATPERRVGG